MLKKGLDILLGITLLITVSACARKAPTWQEQYDLGMRYLTEGNYAEAIIAFTAAIEIDPKRAETYIGLADAYVAQGKMELAQQVLEDALSAVTDKDAVRNRLNRMEGNATPEPSKDQAPNSISSEIESSVSITEDLSISNLTYSYWEDEEWDEEGKRMMNMRFIVDGPSQVREVRPVTWGELEQLTLTPDHVKRIISNILPAWAESWSAYREAPPFEEGFSVPVWQEDRGTTQYFIMVGLDEELSDISYAIVTVEIP